MQIAHFVLKVHRYKRGAAEFCALTIAQGYSDAEMAAAASCGAWEAAKGPLGDPCPMYGPHVCPMPHTPGLAVLMGLLGSAPLLSAVF